MSDPPDELHVIPIGDDVDHEETGDCPCGPHLDIEGAGLIYVHHSLDGREQHE